MVVVFIAIEPNYSITIFQIYYLRLCSLQALDFLFKDPEANRTASTFIMSALLHGSYKALYLSRVSSNFGQGWIFWSLEIVKESSKQSISHFKSSSLPLWIGGFIFPSWIVSTKRLPVQAPAIISALRWVHLTFALQTFLHLPESCFSSSSYVLPPYSFSALAMAARSIVGEPTSTKADFIHLLFYPNPVL